MPQDVFRDRTECGEPPSRGRLVTPTVGALRIPTRVVLSAVTFDDQPAIDQEVDPADPRNVDLRLEGTPQRPQDQAHQSFGAGLGASVDEAPQGVQAPRESVEKFVEVVLVDETEMKCGIDRGERSARRLADERIADGVEGLNDERAGVRRSQELSAVKPMRQNRAGES